MDKVKFRICINPFTRKIEKVCDRQDNPCCMCIGIDVVSINEIRSCIDLLGVSGNNTKKEVKNRLERLLEA